MDNSRTEFEAEFPVPRGIYWDAESGTYEGEPGRWDAGDDYDEKYRVWQAATEAARGGVEPVGEVVPMMQVDREYPENTKGVALVDRDLPLGTKVYTQPPAPADSAEQVKALEAELALTKAALHQAERELAAAPVVPEGAAKKVYRSQLTGLTIDRTAKDAYARGYGLFLFDNQVYLIYETDFHGLQSVPTGLMGPDLGLEDTKNGDA